MNSDIFAYFDSSQINPENNLIICVTFDKLLLGALNNTHFRIDFETRQLKKIENFNDFLNGLMSDTDEVN